MPAARRPSASVVKLKPQPHAKLLEFAKQDDRPMGNFVTYLVDRYEQERFWMQAREDVASRYPPPTRASNSWTFPVMSPGACQAARAEGSVNAR